MKYYTVEGKQKSIFKVFAIYYICMALFCVVRILAGIEGVLPEGKWGDVAFSFVIQVIILFLIPFVLYNLFLKVSPKQTFEHCNFSKINIAVILISLVLGVLCFIINIAVSSLFNGMISFTGYRFGTGGGSADYSTWNFLLQLFLVAVLPAFCEEFLHRGILLQGIKHIGFKKAIVLSSLLFGLLHFNIQQVAYAIVIGLILGFVSVVAKNIWPAIIIHFMNNAISTYLDFAAGRGWIFGDILNNLQNALASGNTTLVFIISSLVLIAVIVLLCLMIWLLYKQSIIKKVNKAIDKAYKSSSAFFRNAPIHLTEEHEAIRDLLENSTLLNLDVKAMDNPIDIVMPKEKSRYAPKRLDKLFLWGALVLGVLVTLFSYSWGLF